MSGEKLMLVDGNSLLFKAFYALPLLHNREGVFTNAVYGFLTMLNRVLEQENPTHVVVAFDKDKKTFRQEMYGDYKANRVAAPDELLGQFALIRQVLDALNITYLEQEGYEADDIIGTLSYKAEQRGIDTVIVTGDGDALQLVSDKVKVLMSRKGITDIAVYDEEEVKNKWGVEPYRLVEVKALMGDSSDNIPGVDGIGPKTAVKLIKEYGDLENLYAHIDEIKGGKLAEKLKEQKDIAFLSRELATIKRNVDIAWDEEKFKRREPDWQVLKDLYQKLEFNSFLQALEKKGSGLMPETSTLPSLEVREVKGEKEALELVQRAKREGEIALAFKADYHHPMWARIEDIFCALGKDVYRLHLDEEEKILWLRPLLEDENIKKVVHNAKFMQVILSRYGVSLRGLKGDILLLSYVHDPALDAEDICQLFTRFLGIRVEKSDIPLQVGMFNDLYQVIYQETPAELIELLDRVEMPLSFILADMEMAGIKVDKRVLEELTAEFANRIKKYEEKIYTLAGGEFNINSPKQLGKVLFEDLGLKVVKKTKTGYATGVEVLEELYDQHEIIPYILGYRQLAKLKSTYTDALANLIHPVTGRVHTIFKQAQTVTGRLSSVEPNLQNIPVKMEEGRRIRKAFVACDEDHVLLSADYSQIDLRSLAHISGDEVLIDTFVKGIDIHRRTASEIFKVPLEKVDEELRRRAKAVNFGIIYGISDFGLARDTGVSRKEAREYIEKYLNSYPGVKRYMEEIVEMGKKYGYVETILKRRRYLPELNSPNKTLQALARRMALNTPIQGTSADIIKLAMLRIDEELKKRGLKAKMLLQVHDDLIFEVPRDELEETAALIKQGMENAIRLKVPLEVAIKVGPNWYDMQPLELGKS
ncbi:DNA polymerase I [Thermosyntropha lipolytica DSM 11003]|uniref:DNA polymerase I n=1 Tax=Thermosyntropha lipolytica DSM 11003 TaxID=1123382 RepID=A0A1M5MZV3_9FIRM|nr:DNA polymerase I [Thermosyntropha lipolytica]SHG82811.1 DNA polymerase I [Thermosyntropha lipolytica DSM 11003]